MKKRAFIIIVISISVLLIFIYFFYLKEKKEEPIRTAGTVKAREVNLSSKVKGRLSEICCKEGMHVQSGTVVFRIESSELEAELESAQASLERARADVLASEANVAVARTKLDKARRDRERIESLFRDGFVSQADLDDAVTKFDSARATYDASVSTLSSAKAHIKEAEAELLLSKTRLSDTEVKTPFSGLVVYRALEPGEYVTPGLTVLTIVDLDDLWVRVDLDESLIGYVTYGSEAFITIDGIPSVVIKGKVSEIGSYADFAMQRDVRYGRQDIKTFHVKIRFEDRDKILKPGMTVNVEIPRKKQ
jgi:HlyD family secretion protein